MVSCGYRSFTEQGIDLRQATPSGRSAAIKKCMGMMSTSSVRRDGSKGAKLASAKLSLFIAPDPIEVALTTKAQGARTLVLIVVSAASPGSGIPRGWIVLSAGEYKYRLVIINQAASVSIARQTTAVTVRIHTGRDFLGQTGQFELAGLSH